MRADPSPVAPEEQVPICVIDLQVNIMLVYLEVMGLTVYRMCIGSCKNVYRIAASLHLLASSNKISNIGGH